MLLRRCRTFGSPTPSMSRTRSILCSRRASASMILSSADIAILRDLEDDHAMCRRGQVDGLATLERDGPENGLVGIRTYVDVHAENRGALDELEEVRGP